MTYRGHVKNGVVVFGEAYSLPEGTAVEVRAAEAPASSTSIRDKLLAIAGTVEGLPEDAAENHDHYLYGT